MTDPQQHLNQEKVFLNDVGISLNAALFIIDRLIEELKGEQGRPENDAEVEKLFHHLAGYLVKVDQQIKNRHSVLSELLLEEIKKKREAEASFENTL